jgi:PAS domain S-box-containing protein
MALDGTITGWNPATERLFGYSTTEAIGNSIDLITPSDRLPEVRDILRRIRRGERIEHHETIRVHKEGHPVEVSIGISAIKTLSGAIIGASNTARDITVAKRTQRTLNQEIEERRRIFETSQDLILVTDPKGILVQVSPSARAILGYSPEEMVGRCGSLFVHGDDLDHARNEIRAIRHRQLSRNFDSRFMHKDGRMVTLSWVGTWSEPVKRHFFIGRDMTESRRAQETLRESEQLAHGIIDTALDAFVQTDAQGGILDWNSQAEKIFGWPRHEALGKNFIDLVVVETDNEILRHGLSGVLNFESDELHGGRREIIVRHRDRREFRAELSVTALKRRDGFVFNGFFRDLTDKIAAEERLRQAEKMEALGQLTGGIAHDFNNILTVITGTIEILAGAVAKEPQLAAITGMIDDAAARGANLTQQLLAFARKQPLQPRQTDVNTLIIDTVKLLRTTLGEQIEIESVFEDESCLATVDPNQLATAILNLSINARDAMPNGGKLIFETGTAFLDENYTELHDDLRPGRFILIAVSDTGTGIPADMLDKVFNPFFTSKGPGKGTGLGLSMVYGFVKQSAGHIKIYSEQGHGTTIKMYLPPGNGTGLTSEASTASAFEGGKETILVVEDDKLVRDYVLTQLHSLGYVTLDAANATEALALLQAGHDFDLLFTDVIMPGMNGPQLANEIEIRKPELKVLYTSGYTENAILHHGRLDAGVLLLAKPYRKSDMALMIRRALAS